MLSPEKVRSYILENLHCDHVSVEGDGAHFDAVIVSAEFRGKSRVQQHQMVYDALKGNMGGALHALALQTSAPD